MYPPPIENSRNPLFRCYWCQEHLPESSFARDASKSRGFKSICVLCDREKSLWYYDANRESKKLRYHEMQEARPPRHQRQCANCDQPATSNRHHYCDRCRKIKKSRSDVDRAREARRVRKTSTERGYGSAHQKLRKKVAPFVQAGRALCARCGKPIAPTDPWDLGHDDDDRSRYVGPEHRACNRGAGAIKGNARRTASRRW